MFFSQKIVLNELLKLKLHGLGISPRCLGAFGHGFCTVSFIIIASEKNA